MNHAFRVGAWTWMTPEKREAIRRFKSRGPDMTTAEIAEMFSVTPRQVQYALRPRKPLVIVASGLRE